MELPDCLKKLFPDAEKMNNDVLDNRTWTVKHPDKTRDKIWIFYYPRSGWIIDDSRLDLDDWQQDPMVAYTNYIAALLCDEKNL